MNIAAYLAKAARQWPDNVASVHEGETRTYREFHDRALRVGSGLLALGLERGDRVAFAYGNGPHVLETLYGCFAAGLVAIPINPRLHAREMAYIATNAGARVLLHGPEYQDGLVANWDGFPSVEHRVCLEPAEGATTFEELLGGERTLETPVDVDPDDVCWLFYTSGTTGKPKGAMLTHRSLTKMLMNYLADVHNIQPGDVVLHAAPMSHGSGLVALPAVARGAANVAAESKSFDPKALFEQIQRQRVSHVAFMAPTQIIAMLDDFVPGEFDLSSLQAICYGGAPIYVEHLKRAVDAFGPIFAQIYGQGEAPITITGLPARAHAELLAAGDDRIGSVGQTRTDVEARIVDGDDRELPPGEIGEVVARGDVVMKGYWDNPEATEETLRGGWLHTGDVGTFDEQGYLFLLDRAKDVIISGGNNVYPREVEEVLVQVPGVANVVVLGVPHEYWGEAVHAVVLLEPGAAVTAEQLTAHCGEHLAGYKKPKGIDFVDELPVSGYGKVLRREVRDRYWVGHERQVSGGAAATKA
jgi:acyl-CoA synthetase (AMP-forming)/AMP-acid ligase II